MYICVCNAVTEDDLYDCFKEYGVQDALDMTLAGSKCGKCRYDIELLVEKAFEKNSVDTD